jgi:hypothetical protein
LSPENANTCADLIGLARSNSFAVGDSSGKAVFVVAEGKATSTDVSVVERGIEAERSARKAVCRRWGRMVMLVFTPVAVSSSGRLRTWRVIWTRVRGMRRVRIMLRRVL